MNYEGYYFNPLLLIVMAGAKAACLDQYQVELSAPAVEQSGDLYLKSSDLNRILATTGLKAPVLEEDKKYTVAAVFAALGCSIQKIGPVHVVLLQGQAEIPEEAELKKWLNQEKYAKGDYFGTYWHSGMKRLASYRVYLPESYNPEKKNPMIMGLHGGGGNPNNIFKNSKEKIKKYAEKGGYILVAPDGSTNNSTYGCVVHPFGMLKNAAPAADPENPANLNETELAAVHQGQVGLDLVMDLMRKEYSLDEGHLYLIGNSMGGMGTLYYASQNPGLFRKICPQGAIPDMNYFDCSGLKKQQILFVAGEKDSHGVEWLREGCRMMKEQGVPVIYREVKNGTHSSAWVDVLDEIFKYLEQ